MAMTQSHAVFTEVFRNYLTTQERATVTDAGFQHMPIAKN